MPQQHQSVPRQRTPGPAPPVKEVLKHFKKAPWKRPEEARPFVSAASRLDPVDLVKLLQILTHKKFAADAVRHRIRCAVFSQTALKGADPSLFLPFVRTLKTCDHHLRAALMPLLPAVNDPAEHGELCALLRSPDTQLRRSVAEALQQLGSRSAIDHLADMVDERSFPGRGEAVQVLLVTAGPRAIPVFRSVLRRGDPSERVATVRALADPQVMDRNRPGALHALSTALADDNPGVLQQATAALAGTASEEEYLRYLGPFLESENPRLVRTAVAGLKRFDSPAVIRILERRLVAGPDEVRFQVLQVLEEIANDSVLPPLVEALGHKRIAVRTRAREILTRLSQASKLDVTRTIIWLLRSRDVDVRRGAAEIAGSVRDPDGQLWPVLLGHLRDEDWWVRESVADALVSMAGKRLTRPMVAFLSDESDTVRRFAVGVLTRLKDPEALGALVRTAGEDKDWWVQETAIEAIAAIGDERAVPYLVDFMSRNADLRLACINALGQLRARQAAPHVAAVLQADDADVRKAALDCLGRLQALDQAQVVEQCTFDPSPRVRKAARDLLLSWRVAVPEGEDAADTEVASGLDDLLEGVAEEGGEVLILASGRPPNVKKMGELVRLCDEPFPEEQVGALLMPLLNTRQLEDLQALRDADFSHESTVSGSRYRVNVFRQEGGLSAVFKRIQDTAQPLAELGLPEQVTSFAGYKDGLVVVAGPSASGKSTTLAALVDHINRTSRRHIVSLEDPIEVVHDVHKGVVNQRELGAHIRSYEAALRGTLRQDADVLLIGELRDPTTIEFALTAAETGHLVLGTTSTQSAHTTVDRLVSAYPPALMDQVQARLAEALKAVVCQALLRKEDGDGLCVAVEVMIVNDAIANLVRTGKAVQIPSVIATAREQGMQLLDTHLLQLLRAGTVEAEEAYMRAQNKADFEEFLTDDDDEGADATEPGQPDDAVAGPAGT